MKVSHEPQAVTHKDFDELRSYGVIDEDIIEIIMVTAVAVLSDIIADTLKVPVETAVYNALGRP